MTIEGEVLARKAPPLRLVLYGDKSVGKTTFALTASRPFVLDFDGSLEGEAVPEDPDIQFWVPEKWQQLNEFKDEAKTMDRDTIVVDTGNALARFLTNQSVDTWAGTGRPKGAAEMEIGKAVPELRDYNALAIAMDRFLTALRFTGKDIIVTVHTRFPDPTKGEYRRGPDLPAATAKVLEEWANVYGELVLDPKTDKRTLHWAPSSPERKAGNRWRSALGPGMADPTVPRIKAAIKRAYRPRKDPS